MLDEQKKINQIFSLCYVCNTIEEKEKKKKNHIELELLRNIFSGGVRHKMKYETHS
jgi:hypothetical protein